MTKSEQYDRERTVQGNAQERAEGRIALETLCECVTTCGTEPAVVEPAYPEIGALSCQLGCRELHALTAAETTPP